jgi:hypothetical protein
MEGRVRGISIWRRSRHLTLPGPWRYFLKLQDEVRKRRLRGKAKCRSCHPPQESATISYQCGPLCSRPEPQSVIHSTSHDYSEAFASVYIA